MFTPCRGALRRNSGITAGNGGRKSWTTTRKEEWFPVMARQLHHSQCLEGTPRTYASSSRQNLSMERGVEPEILPIAEEILATDSYWEREGRCSERMCPSVGKSRSSEGPTSQNMWTVQTIRTGCNVVKRQRKGYFWKEMKEL